MSMVTAAATAAVLYEKDSTVSKISLRVVKPSDLADLT